jgi:N utilization substance protein A
MASLASGTPLSVLVDHGLAENVVELLVAGGVGTLERLASMTPEELVTVQGIDEELVGRITTAVNAYYEAYEEGGAQQEQAETQTSGLVLSSAEPPAEAPPAPEAGAEPSPEESDTIESSGLPAD